MKRGLIMNSDLTEMSDEHENSKINREIDANLKRVYSGLLEEDVPDRLKQLLAELRKKEAKK